MSTPQIEVPGTTTMTACGAEDGLAQQRFEFREVTEVGEVESVLELRHRVYSATEAMRGFVDPQGPPILMDGYDSYSRLFGLFEVSPRGPRLIGTLRGVTLDLGPAHRALEMIAASHPALRTRLRAPRRKPIPMLEACPDACAVASRVQLAIARGEAVAEAGRFALDPAFRAAFRARLALARHMIELAMAYLFLPDGFDRAFIICIPEHARMYERVGFRRVSQVGRLPWLSAPEVELEIDRDCVSGEIRSRVLDRADDLAATGRVRLTTLPDGSLEAESAHREVHGRPAGIRRPRPSDIVHPALRVAAAH